MFGIAKIAEAGFVASASIAALLLFLGAYAFDMVMPIGLIFTPFMLICSSAVVAFVVLRQGENAALQCVALAAVMVLVGTHVLNIYSIRIVLYMVTCWGGAAIAAVVLKRTVSLSTAVLSVIPPAIVLVLISNHYREALTQFWHKALAAQMGSVSEAQSELITADQLQEMITGMSQLMAISVANWAVIVVICSLFLARSWQARLINAGGFQKEFHALKFGRQAVWLCFGAVLLAVVTNATLWSAVASVMMFVFFIQGLSVLHCLVKQRGMSQGWLIGMYCLMLLPQMVLLIGALGLADNLFRLRQT